MNADRLRAGTVLLIVALFASWLSVHAALFTIVMVIGLVLILASFERKDT